MLHRLTILASVCLLASASLSLRAETDPRQTRARNAEAADKAYRENLVKYKGNDDFLVLPGLVADKKNKTVTLTAEATALTPDKPVEFFLIPPNSGKDYEALSVVFAKPSDIHKAVEFIGVKPGRPVDFSAARFWPRGERVLITFEWTEPPPPDAPAGAKPATRRAPIENLILSTRTGKQLPATGLIFTGSYWTKDPQNPGKTVYGADISDSKSIASDYNEPSTVFDLPRLAPQGEVYSTQKPNPDYRFTPGQRITVTIEPEHKDGKLRVHNLALAAKLSDKGDPALLKDYRFTLADAAAPDNKLNKAGDNLLHAVAAMADLAAAGQDPYVSVTLDPAMPLSAVLQTYTLLTSLETPDGIRIEPPAPGQFSHRAFFPNENWRQRQNRLGQPWELHITLDKNAKSSAMLRENREDWNVTPTKVDQIDTVVTSPDQLAQTLKERDGDRPRAIFVFAPAELTYSALQTLLAPALADRHTVYVFLPPKADADKP